MRRSATRARAPSSATAAAAPPRYIEWRVPTGEALRRARARERDPAARVRADAAIAARLAAAWAPLDEVPADRHLILRTDRRPEEAVLDVGAWLDRVSSRAT